MNFFDYLENQTIISMGKLDEDNCIAVEVISKDAIGFVRTILENHCYVSSIRWWERVSLSKKPIVGYGGTPDPRDPHNYYFAETDICALFGKETGFEEYISYFSTIKQKYLTVELYPAFDVYRV